jgi:formylglycine-generating enzyme required for sulfatase activity
MSQFQLDPTGAAEWERLLVQLEIGSRFFLGFVFCDHPATLAAFVERSEAILDAVPAGARVVRALSASDLLERILPTIFEGEELAIPSSAPVWIDLTTGDDEAWRQARTQFLARLNERRERMRRRAQRPLILALPSSAQRQVRDVAPDLWSIREYSNPLGDWARSTTKPKVFLCYRRSDATKEALRLRNELQAGNEGLEVFLDTQSIEGGDEWPTRLRKELEESAVQVVLIGPGWLGALDEAHRRRIDAKNDWVRAEIERGLTKNRQDARFLLLPLLLGDTTALRADHLPDSIATLADIQALRPEDGSFANVIARIRDHLRSLAPRAAAIAAPAAPTERAALDRYLEGLRQNHRDLPLVGFPKTVRVPIRLEELYVPLEAAPDLRRDFDERFVTSKQLDPYERDGALGRIQLLDAFRHAFQHGKRKGVVILGDPGAGKTTHMRRLALGLASGDEFGPLPLGLPADLLPVFLPLRRLQRSDLDTRGEHLLLRAFEGELDAATAQHLMRERGRLLYLLDGLDEVPIDLRIDAARWIESLRKHDDTSWFAITSRYAGYTEDVSLDAHFLELHIRPLTDAQIESFVHNWYRIVETTFEPATAAVRAPQRAKDLLERLRAGSLASTRVAEMSANPLLLTILCLIHRDRGQVMPQARRALYEDCLRCLLGLWRDAKTLGSQFRYDDAERLLQPMALDLHQRQATRLPASELTLVLERQLARLRLEVTSRQFLDAVRDESGLLVGWSGDLYGFLHLGFQEHLAAREILVRSQDAALSGDRLELLESLAARFGESWWEEVTLLLLAQCTAIMFRRFFELVLQRSDFPEHEDLLQQCLREAREKDPAPFEALLARRNPQASAEQRAVAERAIQQIEGRTPRIEVMSPTVVVSTDRVVHPASGVELVRVPAGSFPMGGTRYNDEKPIRAVIFAQPFWIATTPVTNEQYRRFCEATGHTPPESFKNRAFNGADQPVVMVTWDDAQAFCTWAGLELPSESMWEYACRAGTTTEYWSGNSAADLARVGWYAENAGERLHAVAEKAASPWGLFDVHGNVWEWCEDTWHGSYRDAPADGRAWVDQGSTIRVVRGGSFGSDAAGCRSAFRDRRHPSYRFVALGLRPASSSLPHFTTS